MFDKRLFALAPGLGKLIAGKVACMWVGLLANISLMASMVGLLAGLLAAADPHAIACALSCPVDAADCMAGCPTNNLFDMPGRIALPAPNIVIICGVLPGGTLPYHCHRRPTRHRSGRARQTGLAIQALSQNAGPWSLL